jgi:hypothetical protein
MPKARRQMLSDVEFLALSDVEDAMRVVIGTHSALNDALGRLLAEALPDPDMPELDRIGFTLKVDLQIAMRVLWSGARPAWRDFNQLRNTFAHDAKATVTEARAGQLRSTVPDSLWSGEASEPLDIIRLVAAVLWVQVTTRLTAMRDTAAQWRYVNQRLHALRSGLFSDPDLTLEEVVQRDRAARKARGER